MIEPSTIARPYARAAFAVAGEDKAIAEWSSFLQILDGAVQDEQIARTIANPSISAKQIAQAICEGFGEQISEHQKRFICLLAEGKRLGMSSHIVRLFDVYRADQEQSVNASIVSAKQIDPKQLEGLHKTMEERLKKRVVIEETRDEKLIGGAKIYVGDQILDGSYQEKLAQLAAEIVH